jgi:hypothetical protein
MSWSLRKPNVTLRVTRFKPARDLVAGLTAAARAAHRAKRARECRRVIPAATGVTSGPELHRAP